MINAVFEAVFMFLSDCPMEEKSKSYTDNCANNGTAITVIYVSMFSL